MSQDTRLKDTNIFSATMLGKFKAESAFSDSGLADDSNDTAVALQRAFEFERKSGKLIVAADQGTQPTTASEHLARWRVLQSANSEYINGSCNSADVLLAQRLDFDKLFGRGITLFGD